MLFLAYVKVKLLEFQFCMKIIQRTVSVVACSHFHSSSESQLLFIHCNDGTFLG